MGLNPGRFTDYSGICISPYDQEPHRADAGHSPARSFNLQETDTLPIRIPSPWNRNL